MAMKGLCLTLTLFQNSSFALKVQKKSDAFTRDFLQGLQTGMTVLNGTNILNNNQNLNQTQSRNRQNSNQQVMDLGVQAVNTIMGLANQIQNQNQRTQTNPAPTFQTPSPNTNADLFRSIMSTANSLNQTLNHNGTHPQNPQTSNPIVSDVASAVLTPAVDLVNNWIVNNNHTNTNSRRRSRSPIPGPNRHNDTRPNSPPAEQFVNTIQIENVLGGLEHMRQTTNRLEQLVQSRVDLDPAALLQDLLNPRSTLGNVISEVQGLARSGMPVGPGQSQSTGINPGPDLSNMTATPDNPDPNPLNPDQHLDFINNVLQALTSFVDDMDLNPNANSNPESNRTINFFSNRATIDRGLEYFLQNPNVIGNEILQGLVFIVLTNRLFPQLSNALQLMSGISYDNPEDFVLPHNPLVYGIVLMEILNRNPNIVNGFARHLENLNNSNSNTSTRLHQFVQGILRNALNRIQYYNVNGNDQNLESDGNGLRCLRGSAQLHELFQTSIREFLDQYRHLTPIMSLFFRHSVVQNIDNFENYIMSLFRGTNDFQSHTHIIEYLLNANANSQDRMQNNSTDVPGPGVFGGPGASGPGSGPSSNSNRRLFNPAGVLNPGQADSVNNIFNNLSRAISSNRQLMSSIGRDMEGLVRATINESNDTNRNGSAGGGGFSGGSNVFRGGGGGVGGSGCGGYSSGGTSGPINLSGNSDNTPRGGSDTDHGDSPSNSNLNSRLRL